ncbi:MAG: sulfurtransferase [Chloroflexota bacterium]|nr:sulfurtransferase [Chloroflexota bacterium]
MRRLPTCLCGILLLATLTLAGCGDQAAAPATLPPSDAAQPPTALPGVDATKAPRAAATGLSGVSDAFVVTVADLTAQVGDPHLRLVDMGSGDEYAAGHLPGAIHIDWTELDLGDTQPSAVAAWQSRMSDLLGKRGIGDGDRVVVYDHGTLYDARLWWVLDQLGHAEKQILNGGFAAWQGAGGTVEKPPVTLPAVIYSAHPQPAGLASKTEVEALLGQANTRLLDARSPGEYAAGHIPGAVNVPFTLTADGTPLLFKSPADLHALFAAQGVTASTAAVTYCTTGVRGAVDYVALRRAGFANVRLFTGSWAEWSRDPAGPVEK